jgi:hypothetical protein
MNDPQDWIGSQFTVADLHDKVVDYAFQDEGHLYCGEGRLIAVAKGNLMRVRIVCEMDMAKDRSHVFGKVWNIPGSDAAKLVRNPSGSKNSFDFRNA